VEDYSEGPTIEGDLFGVQRENLLSMNIVWTIVIFIAALWHYKDDPVLFGITAVIFCALVGYGIIWPLLQSSKRFNPPT
jgi:hypothetical protein